MKKGGLKAKPTICCNNVVNVMNYKIRSIPQRVITTILYVNELWTDRQNTSTIIFLFIG